MLITLTTDFGYFDPFVGIIKGVIAGINPQAQVIDISHGVPPQDIMGAALILQQSIRYFPPATIHVVVVDPGVGSERYPVLIESDENYFIGPDNGVMSLALEKSKPSCIIHLSEPVYHLQPTSRTFHGRDIFAPVAAHLSLGANPSDFGPVIDNFVKISWPNAKKTNNAIVGQIIYIDHFGNLCTTVREGDLAGLPEKSIQICLGDLTIHGLADTYAAVKQENFAALVNSWGLLEIAYKNGSAQLKTSAKIGDKVQIRTA